MVFVFLKKWSFSTICMGFFSPNLSFKGSNCFLSAQKGGKKQWQKNWIRWSLEPN